MRNLKVVNFSILNAKKIGDYSLIEKVSAQKNKVVGSNLNLDKVSFYWIIIYGLKVHSFG